MLPPVTSMRLPQKRRQQKAPQDFIARLAALVPKPRVTLRRLYSRVCSQQPVPGAGDIGQAGQGEPGSLEGGYGGANTG